MPPKLKRKAGKAGEGEPPALKAKPSDDLIDEDEKPEGISGLAEELLHKIYSELDVVSRINFSLTCERFYRVRERFSASTSPQTWSHLAIQTTLEEVDSGQTGQRASRRLKKPPSQTRMVVEIEMRNGDCKSHDVYPSICKYEKSMKKILSKKEEVLYWKTSLDGTTALLKSIFLSMNVTYVCAKVDLSDPSHEWFEKLSQLKCESMRIQHVKAVCDVDREEREEPAVLSPSLFSAAAPFFMGAERLTLIDVRMERADYPIFYEKVKLSSMRVEWRFTDTLSAMEELPHFARAIFGVNVERKYPENRDLLSDRFRGSLTTTHKTKPVYSTSQIDDPIYLGSFAGIVLVDGGWQSHLRLNGRLLITTHDLIGPHSRGPYRNAKRLPYRADKRLKSA